LLVDTALFDIDGILTDGMVYICSDGKEMKKISCDDMDAIFELKRRGIKIGFITGESGPFCEYVKNRFKPDYWSCGRKDKLNFFKELMESHGLDRHRTSYAGDARKDIELLQFVDYSFAPSDVDDEIKKAAKYTVRAMRGNGVIKEVARFLLNDCADGLKHNPHSTSVTE
jgi:3-deoxy-D-manno-octulosonate 8-phosphate phosphatase (KDO 8-P phosphatase)